MHRHPLHPQIIPWNLATRRGILYLKMRSDHGRDRAANYSPTRLFELKMTSQPWTGLILHQSRHHHLIEQTLAESVVLVHSLTARVAYGEPDNHNMVSES